MRQELVKRGFTSNAAHSGLSKLKHGVVDVLDLVDGFAGVGYFVVDNGVHFATNIIFGNGILLGDIDRFGTNINFVERLKDGDNQFPARTQDIAKFAHGIDDTTLVFVDLLERDQNDKDNNG